MTDFTSTFHFHALEKEMATHSSILAWRIPGREEPSGLPSMGSHRVRHDWSDLAVSSSSSSNVFNHSFFLFVIVCVCVCVCVCVWEREPKYRKGKQTKNIWLNCLSEHLFSSKQNITSSLEVSSLSQSSYLFDKSSHYPGFYRSFSLNSKKFLTS